jgi:hypothetical protein
MKQPDTIELWELCPHGRAQSHPYEVYDSEMYRKWCPGGRRVVLKWRQRYWHKGTGENGDTSTWFIPVEKDEMVWIEEED